MFINMSVITLFVIFFFFKQKTAYEMRISDWSSDVCSSDLIGAAVIAARHRARDRTFQTRERKMRLGAADQRARQRHGTGVAVLRGALDRREIGRASCRERVCQYV